MHTRCLAETLGFTRAFHPHRTLLVGETGIPIDEFLLRPAGEWVE
jgi:hypothetical protein